MWLMLIATSAMIMIVLIVSAVAMFHKGCIAEDSQMVRQDALDSVKKEFLSTYGLKELHCPDSLSANAQIDVIKTMQAHIEMVEDRQKDIVSDLRQETNNVINKVNGWLGFWIALLALFGGILPMIIQYILFKRSEIKTKEQIEAIAKKANSCHLQLMVSTICLQYELGIVTDNIQKFDLVNIMLTEMSNSIQEMLKLIEENDYEIDDTNEIIVINALIQYGRAIDALIMIEREGGRMYMHLLRLRDDLREFISAMLDHNVRNKRETWNAFKNLCRRLCSLSATSEE